MLEQVINLTFLIVHMIYRFLNLQFFCIHVHVHACVFLKACKIQYIYTHAFKNYMHACNFAQKSSSFSVI